MNLGELIQSKKFKVLLVSFVGILLMSLATDNTVTPEAVTKLVALVMAYLGAQGLADYGKYSNGK